MYGRRYAGCPVCIINERCISNYYMRPCGYLKLNKIKGASSFLAHFIDLATKRRFIRDTHQTHGFPAEAMNHLKLFGKNISPEFKCIVSNFIAFARNI